VALAAAPTKTLALENGVIIKVYPDAIRVLTEPGTEIVSVYESNEMGRPQRSVTLQW